MKHWLRRILFCVFLGVVTTVAVAWGCACYVDVFKSGDLRSEIDITVIKSPTSEFLFSHRAWQFNAPGATRFGSRCLSFDKLAGGRFPGGSPADLLPTWTDYLNPEIGVDRQRGADARGWPMLAMWTAIDYRSVEHDSTGRWSFPETQHGILFPQYDDAGRVDRRRSRFLPLGVIWQGFLGDSGLFAVAWFVTLFAPGLTRRALRRRRGRCPQCNYDLRGLACDPPRCPECGALDDSLDPG